MNGSRTFLQLCRTLHIYLTLLALGVILFFSLSGFMLNHPDWFGVGAARTRTTAARLSPELLREPDKLGIVESLRRQGASGAVSSLEIDDQEIRVVFAGPGRHTDATIQRADGSTLITWETQSIAGWLADLHRAKDAGASWKFILDASAILLFLGALTGLIIFFQLSRRRALGLLCLASGLLLCLLTFLFLVP